MSSPNLATTSESFTFGVLICGLIFIAIGSTHLLPKFARWDTCFFRNSYANMKPLMGFFRYIWPLGTTPVALVLVSLTYIPDRWFGILTTLIYFSIAAIERIAKLKLNRPRPFQSLPDLVIGQPAHPGDPSHPSGDAMRVWFLAIIIPVAFNLPWPVIMITGVLAIALSLGRIALGVHFPLDVVGGAGLGFAGAGLTLLCAGFL